MRCLFKHAIELIHPKPALLFPKQINGEVIRISADLNQPGGDLAPFYTVRLRLADDEESKLGPLVLRPGMPVEAFLQTSERSPLSYFLKPLSDQLRHAFREK